MYPPFFQKPGMIDKPVKHDFKIGERVKYTTLKYGTLEGNVKSHTAFGVIVKFDSKQTLMQVRPGNLKRA